MNDDAEDTQRMTVASSPLEGLVRLTSQVRLRAVRAVATVHELAAQTERRRARVA